MAQVTIYTTPSCPYCHRARTLLAGLGVAYVDVDVSDPALRREISDRYAWRTVPMIVVNGRFLGGFDDVSALHRRGGLVPLVTAPEA